ncbi:phage minor capsid protein [Vagococcus salmoninarum]|uniref:phage minor capsid protein n=1 Tax=Vagococcus salmoninarum TaxID=2739 RepID=UPI003F9B84ED
MATKYNPSEKRIIEAYEKGIAEINKLLLNQLSLDAVDIDKVINQNAILKQLTDELAKMDKEAHTAVVDSLTERFTEGRLAFLTEVGLSTDISFSKISHAKLKVIIADTMSDLLAATANTEDSLKQLVREVLEKRLQLSAMVGEGWQEMASKLVEELSAEGLSKWITEEGFVGIIDSNGKKWNLKTYVDTVVRTKLMDADIEAGRVEGLQTGVDLAVISQHGAKDDCAKWEGCIVSMNGMTEGFPLYADIKATNECFHPRCQHHLQPVRNIELIHESTIKQSAQKMKENWQTLKQ